MRKILLSICLFIICSCGLNATIQVTIGSVSAIPGQVVEIPVTISIPPGKYDFLYNDLVIKYDSKSISPANGRLTDFSSLFPEENWFYSMINIENNMKISYLEYSSFNITFPDNIVLFNLQILYTGNTSTVLAWDTEKSFFVKSSGEPLPIELVNGTITPLPLPSVPILALPFNNSFKNLLNTTLQWTETSDAKKYRVQVSASETFTNLIVDEFVSTPSKQLSNLSDSTLYFWRVCAINESDTSAWSSTYNFTTLKLPLLPPVLLTPINSDSQIEINPTLSWENAHDATSYRIQVSFSENFFYSVIVDEVVTTNEKQLSNLVNYAKYYWRVCSKKGTDSTYWSPTYSFTTKHDKNNYTWAKSFSGSSSNSTNIVKVDAEGNVLVIGTYYKTLNLGNGVSLNSEGYNNSYLAKFNSKGECQWGQTICSPSSVYALDMAVSNQGNIYVAGYYKDTLNLGNGISQISKGNEDGFVTKFNSMGQCQWAKSLGDTLDDYVYSVAVDSKENVYFTASFKDLLNYDDIWASVAPDYYCSYLARINTKGVCQLVENLKIGICSFENNYRTPLYKARSCVLVDNKDNFYVAGSYSGENDFGRNKISIESNGDYDGYVVKYYPNGTCHWAKSLGGYENTDYHDPICDYTDGIAVDSTGNVYVIGTFSDTMDLGNNVKLCSPGVLTSYIVKLSPDGICNWGVENGDRSRPNNSIAVSESGTIYMVESVRYSNPERLEGVIYCSLDTYGKYWNHYSIRGNNVPSVAGVALDSKNNIYTIGSFSGKINFGYGIELTADYNNINGFLLKVAPINYPIKLTPKREAKKVSVNTPLVWDTVRNAIKYRVQLALSEKLSNTIIDTIVETTKIENIKFEYNKKYFWRVQAIFGADSSEWSSIWNFSTVVTLPSIPVLISPKQNEYQIGLNPVLTWHTSENTTSYRVQFVLWISSSNNICDTIVKDTTFQVYNLNGLTAYSWRVKAINATDSSVWSDRWTFMTTEASKINEHDKTIFTISPQPVQNEVIVTFNTKTANAGIESEISIEFYDIRGALVTTYNFTSLNEGTNKLRFDVSNIPSGMYNVIIKSGNEVHQTKMIKVD